jgi:hypothetical protein
MPRPELVKGYGLGSAGRDAKYVRPDRQTERKERNTPVWFTVARARHFIQFLERQIELAERDGVDVIGIYPSTIAEIARGKTNPVSGETTQRTTNDH